MPEAPGYIPEALGYMTEALGYMEKLRRYMEECLGHMPEPLRVRVRPQAFRYSVTSSPWYAISSNASQPILEKSRRAVLVTA